MAPSALCDEAKMPDDGMLAELLGQSKGLWDTLLAYLAQEYPGVQNEWSFAGAKYGWSLRPKHKKRTILYLIPGQGCFTASLALGEKAVAAAAASSLPESILDAIRTAKPYVEGRGVRVEVRRPADVAIVKKLVTAKMTH